MACPAGSTCNAGLEEAAKVCRKLARKYLEGTADTDCFGFMKRKGSASYEMCQSPILSEVDGDVWTI